MAEREILFRGKLKDKDEWIGEWIEGIYCPCSWDLYMRRVEKPRIIILSNKGKTDGLWREVIPETVGQYTGLTDKNGKRIFEGDIVEVHYNPSYGGVAKERIGIFIVEFYKGCFMKRKNGTYTYYHFIPTDEHTVIGNIFDDDPICEQISIFEGGGNDG